VSFADSGPQTEHNPRVPEKAPAKNMRSPQRSVRDDRGASYKHAVLTRDERATQLDLARANLASIKREIIKGTPVDETDIKKMEDAIARLEGSVDGTIRPSADDSRP